MSERRIKGWDELKNYDLREAMNEVNRQLELIDAEYNLQLSALKGTAEKLGVSTEKWSKPRDLDRLALVSKAILLWINALKEGLRALEIRVENLEDLDNNR